MLRHSFLAWLAVASCAHAAVRNVTVDDSGKDELTGNEITYYPTGAWNDASDCDGCTAHPAETNLVGGTWHDSTVCGPALVRSAANSRENAVQQTARK